MLIAGLVAGALCALVGWMVVTQGLRTTRSQLAERRNTEQALVTDCLANVDRVIEAPWTTADLVVDSRSYDELDLDHVIDLRNVANLDRVIEAPRTTPDLVADLRSYDELDLDRVIDLRNVAPRHIPAPLLPTPPAPPAPGVESFTAEPPSIWRAPVASAPRSVTATA